MIFSNYKKYINYVIQNWLPVPISYVPHGVIRVFTFPTVLSVFCNSDNVAVNLRFISSHALYFHKSVAVAIIFVTNGNIFCFNSLLIKTHYDVER